MTTLWRVLLLLCLGGAQALTASNAAAKKETTLSAPDKNRTPHGDEKPESPNLRHEGTLKPEAPDSAPDTSLLVVKAETSLAEIMKKGNIKMLIAGDDHFNLLKHGLCNAAGHLHDAAVVDLTACATLCTLDKHCGYISYNPDADDNKWWLHNCKLYRWYWRCHQDTSSGASSYSHWNTYIVSKGKEDSFLKCIDKVNVGSTEAGNEREVCPRGCYQKCKGVDHKPGCDHPGGTDAMYYDCADAPPRQYYDVASEMNIVINSDCCELQDGDTCGAEVETC
jgi:hypothetical protein